MATRQHVLELYESARGRIAAVLHNHATDEQLAPLAKLARIPGNAPDHALLYGAATAEQLAVLAEVVDQQAKQIKSLETKLKAAK